MAIGSEGGVDEWGFAEGQLNVREIDQDAEGGPPDHRIGTAADPFRIGASLMKTLPYS
jgi:hypothetical protein